MDSNSFQTVQMPLKKIEQRGKSISDPDRQAGTSFATRLVLDLGLIRQ